MGRWLDFCALCVVFTCEGVILLICGLVNQTKQKDINMDLRPGVNYFDGVNNFEMFGITNNTVMPVMIAVSPQMAQTIVPPTSGPSKLPTLHENPIHSQYIPSGLILPPNVKPEHIQQLEYPATGSIGVGGSSSSGVFYPMGIANNLCPRHKQQQFFPTNITNKNAEKTKRKWNMETIEEACADSASIDNSSSSTCIPNFILGNLGGGGSAGDNYGGGKSNAEDCTVGCNALMIMGIVGGGGNNSSGNNSSNNPLRFGFTNRSCIDANESVNDLDYAANQPCNCPHVNFDRMSPDVQVRFFVFIISLNMFFCCGMGFGEKLGCWVGFRNYLI